MAMSHRPAQGPLRLLARRLKSEQSGFALIEVMMSALIVAIVSVGVLAGIDASSATSGSNKARGIAASIAQDDQERMRSMQPDDLAAMRFQRRTVTVAGVAYQVDSDARPVTDAGKGCGDGTLVKISSEVTWPKMRNIKPVITDSLVAPQPGSFSKGSGGLIIQVRNRSGGPQTGVPVSITGPQSDADVTDENGCASFLYRPSGAYTVKIQKTGYVTPALVNAISKTETIPSGAVATDSFDYDVAGAVTANIVTIAKPVAPATTGVQVADDSTSLVVSHPNLPAPGIKTFAASPAKTPMTTGTVLYPFTSSYSVYSGTCTGANPLNFPPDAAPTALLTPGGSLTTTVIEPSVNVVVANGATLLAGASVKATNRTCGTGGNLVYTNATLATGRLPKPGMPYGTYDLCASALISGVLRHSNPVLNVLNKAKAGTADVSLQVTAASPTGACP
jgi:prepilin-type N-terminal cleavage/methylation domain-containing protein